MARASAAVVSAPGAGFAAGEEDEVCAFSGDDRPLRVPAIVEAPILAGWSAASPGPT